MVNKSSIFHIKCIKKDWKSLLATDHKQWGPDAKIKQENMSMDIAKGLLEVYWSCFLTRLHKCCCKGYVMDT